MPARLARARRDSLRRRLLEWYGKFRRDLPWRHTDDPYRVWLSETMLQQTRVETVVPYYRRFLERFPDLRSLALADEQDVLKQWEGLGYYSRARNLKRAAERVVRDHGGRVPSDPDALGALPGIGRYTAGAIRSIAFKQAAPVVDGNVKRVLARLLAEPRPSDAQLWDLAGQLVAGEDPDQFNQALMELGATVCVPRNPLCPTCPLRRGCAGAATGRPKDFPARAAKPRPRAVRALGGVLRSRGKLLLLRRPSRGLLGGLWEIPSVPGDDPGVLVETLRERTGLDARPSAALGEVRHVFSHRDLTLRVVELDRRGGRKRARSGDVESRWCGAAEIAQLPLSRLMHKVLELSGR